MISMILFSIFAAVLIGSAMAVVAAKNPVHSVLFLILAFFNAAALFLFAGAEFLSMILVIVYVGAVAVMFLFVVMMLDIKGRKIRELTWRYRVIGSIIGLTFLGELLTLVIGGTTSDWQFSPLVPFFKSHISVKLTNTGAIGNVLYTHYIYPFEVSGIILLVGMIGAIALTHRQKQRSKKQNIRQQISRRATDTLVLTNPEKNAGVTIHELMETQVALSPLSVLENLKEEH